MRRIVSLLAAAFFISGGAVALSFSQSTAEQGCMTPSECCDEPPREGCELTSYSCSSDGTTCNETCTWTCPPGGGPA